MTTPAILLADLSEQGITLVAYPNGQLGYRCAEGAMTLEVRHAITTHKAALLTLLSPPETAPPPAPEVEQGDVPASVLADPRLRRVVHRPATRPHCADTRWYYDHAGGVLRCAGCYPEVENVPVVTPDEERHP